mmetsp:Transcript_81404/g.179005  ORF Transcript_81404/g.179005 Transcript_81404/m.179005 type:complete len:504 (+) Transcript_81404:76-1587(+)
MFEAAASPTASVAGTATGAFFSEDPHQLQPAPPPPQHFLPDFNPIWSPTALLGAVHGGESVRQEFWKQRVRLEEVLQHSCPLDAGPRSPDDWRRCPRGRPHTANNNSSKVGCTLHYGFEGVTRERHLTETGAKLAEPYFHPALAMPLEGEPERIQHHELHQPSMGIGMEVPRIKRVPGAPSTALQSSAVRAKPGCRITVVKPKVSRPSDIWFKESSRRAQRTYQEKAVTDEGVSVLASPRLEEAAISPRPRRHLPPRVRARHQGKPHLYSSTDPTTPPLHIATPRSTTPMSGRGFALAAAKAGGASGATVTAPPVRTAAATDELSASPLPTGLGFNDMADAQARAVNGRPRPASYGGRGGSNSQHRNRQRSGSSADNNSHSNNNNNDNSNHNNNNKSMDADCHAERAPRVAHSSRGHRDEIEAEDAMSDLYQALLGKGPQPRMKVPSCGGQRPQSERSSCRRQGAPPDGKPEAAKQRAVLGLERKFFSRTSRTRPAGVEPIQD